MTTMTTELELNGAELLEVDICGGLSGSVSLQDEFSGFQRGTNPAESPTDTSSSPGRLGAPPGTDAPPGNGPRAPRTSIVDRLLVELYETCSGGGRRHADSWDSSTEASGSDAFLGSSFLQELQDKHTRRHQVNYLAQKAPEELRSIIQEVKYRTGLQSAKLIRQLRRRDRLCHKLQKNYDIVTACLQAVSQKRRKTLQNLQTQHASQIHHKLANISLLKDHKLPVGVPLFNSEFTVKQSPVKKLRK